MIYLIWLAIFMGVWLVEELLWTGFMMGWSKLDKDPTSSGAYAAVWMMGVFTMPVIAAITTGVYYYCKG